MTKIKMLLIVSVLSFSGYLAVIHPDFRDDFAKVAIACIEVLPDKSKSERENK
ncbi:hypothetical protein [Nostoc sp. PA-18-2419]|uniref:hypothetical protein n=1 Tax=Nostoc sp. PA-18-2419 TaxID=2575443 RepID=UPI00167BCCB6|nr:hypothetical protein [Nostoc sp. PA-18-2419]